MTVTDPALQNLLRHFPGSILFLQVRISRVESGFELRHAGDEGLEPEPLRLVAVPDLRELAQTNAEGAFRPLRSAPDLRRGWRALARTEAELAEALHGLYPGGLADWYAQQTSSGIATDYRPYTDRQTGMYRVTQLLEDREVVRVIRSVCPPQFCLKRRLWTVGKHPPDASETKGLIPCFEPCALLLEFARKARRIDQEETLSISLTPSECATLKTALQQALKSPPDPEARTADFSAPGNARRLHFVLEKLLDLPVQPDDLKPPQ